MKRKLQQTEPVSYWKSMVDAITTLMMVILLVLMFFLLNFLTNNSETEETKEEGYQNAGFAFEDRDGYLTPTPTLTPTPIPEIDYDDNNGGGGGSEEAVPTTEILPEITPGEGEVGGDRAAVYAVMVDEETGKEIEISGVVFELYAGNDNKQILSTHYPELVTYSSFETTEDGGFYLPEKIRFDTYYFRQVTELSGYDYTGDIRFEVDEAHEWEDALVVNIPFGPSRNRLQIQFNDKNTGLPLMGKFNVVANGDVTTDDGSIRYYDGEIVDVISCDSSGYGVSGELYLGDYLLQPIDLPTGYAAPELFSREVTLPRRTEPGGLAPLTVLNSEKTSVRVYVHDELNQATAISGLTYSLTKVGEESEARTFVTNETGYFELLDLDKNSSYILKATNSIDGYIMDLESHEFSVDGLGNINGSSIYEMNLFNRMLRVEINVIDRITRQSITGQAVTIVDSEGNSVESWVSDSKPHTINGLEEGIYNVLVDDKNIDMTFRVDNTEVVQKFSTTIMTNRSYNILSIILCIIVVVLLILILVMIRMLKKRRRKKVNG